MIGYEELVEEALKARDMAYTPYSHYRVGAALLAADGRVFRGCNIENASYTPTNCAERTAFFKAVSEGVYDFKAIAIVGGHEDQEVLDMCTPCGVCRQVMREFCDDDFEVVLIDGMTDGKYNRKVFKLTEVLPLSFGPVDMRIKPRK